MPIIITRTVKIVIFSFLLLSTILLLIQKSYAKDISKSIENGQKKAAVCAACHGVNGNSVNPEWPSLANQSVKYKVEQLQHFKSGVRKKILEGVGTNEGNRNGIILQCLSKVHKRS